MAEFLPKILGADGSILSAASGGPPFDPSAYGTVRSWFDARTLTPVSDGTTVQNIPARMGSGTLTQATGSRRPAYYGTAAGGQPALRHDGVDDYVQASVGTLTGGWVAMCVSAFLNNPNQPASDYDCLFVLGDVGNVFDQFVCMRQPPTNTAYTVSFTPTVVTQLGAQVANLGVRTFIHRDTASPTFHECRYNGVTITGGVDDTAARHPIGLFTVGIYATGLSDPAFIDWSQWIIFDGVPAPSTILSCERALGAIYGIVIP